MFRYGIETQNFSLEKTNYENDKPSIIKICKYTSRHCCPKNSISAIAMPHPENVFTIYFNYLIRGTAHVFLKLLPPSSPPVRLDIRQLTSPIRDKRRGTHFQTSPTPLSYPHFENLNKRNAQNHCLQGAFSRML